MSKHLLDETAEFKMPTLGKHASPDTGELQATQRMEPVFSTRPSLRPRPEDAPTR